MCLSVAAVSLHAQVPSKKNHVAYWAANELRRTDTTELTPQAKTASNGVGYKSFLDLQTHKVMISRREKPGTPELHKFETDIFIVQSGGGILQVGGEI